MRTVLWVQYLGGLSNKVVWNRDTCINFAENPTVFDRLPLGTLVVERVIWNAPPCPMPVRCWEFSFPTDFLGRQQGRVPQFPLEIG